MSLLHTLNPAQQQAVLHKDGPLLIVAGAGTGKTTVITARLAYLIEKGLAGADEILALTFTEKAAGEMSDRVEALLPYGYFDLWISTFHSFAERLLKTHGLAIGLPADFKLLNEFEQWALIKKNLDKFDLDYYRPLGNPAKFIRALLKHFSRAKDENINPRQYLEYAGELQENLDTKLSGSGKKGRGNFQFSISNFQTDNKEIAAQEIARINEVANAYHVYQQLLLDNNALDFGDLINYSLKLFRDRPAILEKYRRQFKYILLDEFQDTNWSQYELIKILAAPKNNLVVVGDDDQAIYKFRGASLSNILQFKKDFPDAGQTVLTKNYRSRQNILDLSYEFIKQNNPNRLEWQLKQENKKTRKQENTEVKKKNNLVANVINKKLTAENQGQGEIKLLEGADLAGEVKLVVQKIVELKTLDKSLSWNDFAILIRANDSARDFIAELERRGLPYIFGASRGLYFKPVIMDVIAFFKLLDNYHESAAVWRLLNLPIYDFSDAELINFNHLAGKKALSLFEVLNQASLLKFSPELAAKIQPVLALIAKEATLARDKPVSQVFLSFMNESGYLKYLTLSPSASGATNAAPANKTSDVPGAEPLSEQKSTEAIGLLNQFLRRLQAFESSSDDKTVKAFLAELNLELEAGEEGNLAADLEAGPEAVRILTVHGAKGLEFKYVFIANLADKRFPTIERSEEISLPDALIKEILPEGDVHLEEERRLFYVAMTRARQGLYFSWAPDYGGLRKKKPSRFLVELGLVEKAPLQKGGRGVSNQQSSSKRGAGPLRSRSEAREVKFNPLNPPLEGGRTQIPLTPFDKGGEIPKHFSYSQLAAYTHCPYQYRFAHILKIPVMGKEQFSFGKTMHAVLEKLFRLLMEKKNFGQESLFGNITPLNKQSPPFKGGQNSPPFKRGQNSPPFKGGLRGLITFEEILELYEQCWLDDWYESKKKKQERKKQGREILKVFYEKYKANWPPVLFLEKGFNLKIACPESNRGACPGAEGGAVYTIRGVIDRIDLIPLVPSADEGSSTEGKEGAGLKLVDYKTGRAKEKLTFEDKEQLFIYQLAAEDLFKQPVGALAFYYLDNNSEIEFTAGPGDLEKIKFKIISTIEEIKLGKFTPKPGRLCAFCDFRGICEYRA